MKRKRHNPEQIIRKLRTAKQLLNQGQGVRRRLDRRAR
jgi:putative transposase